MSTLSVQCTVVELPASGIGLDIERRVGLARPAARRAIDMTSDAALVISLDGWAGVNVLMIETDTKVTAFITHADGTDQAIPVNDLLLLVCRSAPITALSLVRVAGQLAHVVLTLGQET